MILFSIPFGYRNSSFGSGIGETSSKGASLRKFSLQRKHQNEYFGFFSIFEFTGSILRKYSLHLDRAFLLASTTLFHVLQTLAKRMMSTGSRYCSKESRTTYGSLDMGSDSAFLPSGGVRRQPQSKKPSFGGSPKGAGLFGRFTSLHGGVRKSNVFAIDANGVARESDVFLTPSLSLSTSSARFMLGRERGKRGGRSSGVAIQVRGLQSAGQSQGC